MHPKRNRLANNLWDSETTVRDVVFGAVLPTCTTLPTNQRQPERLPGDATS